MRLSAPKNLTFLIALVIGVVGIIANFVKIPFVTEYKFWVEVAAFGLLVLGTFLKGL